MTSHSDEDDVLRALDSSVEYPLLGRDRDELGSSEQPSERLTPVASDEHDEETGRPLKDVKDELTKEQAEAKQRALLISFFAMVVVGLGNKIFQVLQLIPMYNYPLFVNLMTTAFYVPASFAYIFPMIKYGSAITEEQMAVPKRKFAVMGALDSIAGIMQTLSVNYIENGSLVILLTQAAIPTSMVISRWLLGTRYKVYQFVGAAVVAVGLVVVLLPSFIHPDKSGNNVVLWSLVLVLSCVPMCLSSVYKERALGDVDLDPVYLNGWIALFQFLLSIPLLLPSAPASNLSIADLPNNLMDGAKCFVGQDTITGTKHPDDCFYSPVYVCIYLVFNISYNVLIILILKYGSANLLWLAMTIMVPLANVSFSLKFMPKHKALKPTDIIGLVVIMSGLITYRFWGKLIKRLRRSKEHEEKRALNQDVTPTPSVWTDFTVQSPDSPAPEGAATPIRGLGAHTTRAKNRRSTRSDKKSRWQ